MQFRTQIPIPKSVNLIDYNSKMVSLGSCFAENMAEKFQYFKFENTENPFGIIFNPVSLEKIILRSIRKEYFDENDIFFHNELWHCFEVHSELSHPDKGEFLNNLNRLVDEFNNQIIRASHVIITLGTSWVYRNKKSNEIVANCHKVPQKQFAKELLSVEKIQQSIVNSIALIQSVNLAANIIFTVSPVRHIKDGFMENQWSKANLVSALNAVLAETVSITPLGARGLFPSYEIMMDELRDYRFYAEDMLHPNQVAIDYIWKRFRETNISETAYSTMDEVETIQKSLAHKPFNPNSESHQKFEIKLAAKINKLVSKYPFMKF